MRAGGPVAPPEFSPGLVAFRASSGRCADSVVEAAKNLSRGSDFVLVLKDSAEVEGRLLPAYISASMRMREGSMHSRSLALEIMLFVAGTMNIGNAVARAGASGSRFIIFASSRGVADALVSKCRLRVAGRCRLRLDPAISSSVALTAISEGK